MNAPPNAKEGAREGAPSQRSKDITDYKCAADVKSTEESDSPFSNGPRIIRDGFGFDDNGCPVPITDGIAATMFDDEEPGSPDAHLTARERRTKAMALVAVKLIAGIETRSMSEVATELGCTRAAVSAIHRTMIIRLGLGKMYERAATRSRQSAAAKAAWLKRAGRTAA